MPIYEYQCRRCGHRLETMQRVSDPPLKRCPECRGALRKLVSAPAFQFKGSGWYVTDYAGKKSGEAGDGGEAGSKTDAKTGAKAEGEGKGEGKGKAGGEASGGTAGGAGKGSKGAARSASGSD